MASNFLRKMTKKNHRKILGGEYENFGWRNIFGGVNV